MGDLYDKNLEILDSKLDKIALGKRLQIEAEHLKRIKTNKITRFYAIMEKSDLKIYTRVLNDMTGELKVDSMDFWDVVRRVIVTVEERGKTLRVHEWTKKSKTDAFIVKQVSSEMKIKLNVKFCNQRGMLKLNEEMKELFSIYSETKPNVIKEFYKYINQKNLLNHTSGFVVCDENLKRIFGVESFDFNDIDRLLEGKLDLIGYCKIDFNFNKPDKAIKGRENLLIYDIEADCDDVTQMPILFSNEVKMLNKKIEGNKILEKRLMNKIEDLQEFIDNPLKMISRCLILEKDIIGIKTKYYEDLNVQSTLYELLMDRKEE
ncbi:hypothetical protein NUSPORA_01061 [Nucleospora cyclopteri]